MLPWLQPLTWTQYTHLAYGYGFTENGSFLDFFHNTILLTTDSERSARKYSEGFSYDKTLTK